VTPSLVDVASSAARLSKLSVTDDRAKPVSSNLARVRAAEIDTADAAAKAKHAASVYRTYVQLGHKDVADSEQHQRCLIDKPARGYSVSHSVLFQHGVFG